MEELCTQCSTYNVGWDWKLIVDMMIISRTGRRSLCRQFVYFQSPSWKLWAVLFSNLKEPMDPLVNINLNFNLTITMEFGLVPSTRSQTKQEKCLISNLHHLPYNTSFFISVSFPRESRDFQNIQDFQSILPR